MTVDTITVYRRAPSSSVPAPKWLCKAHELAARPGIGWAAALELATGSSASTSTIGGTRICPRFTICRCQAGGITSSSWIRLRIVAAVWVPEPADWLPFYSAHVTPFLQAHANIEIAEQLIRVGNCLIAFARHGEGQHVNRDCGRSQYDIDRDREILRRAARAARAQSTATGMPGPRIAA